MDTLLEPLAGLHLSPALWLAIVVGMTAAYVIFGIAGFGTALVAGPVLAHGLPLASIVPLLALLDCAAAASNVARDRQAADRGELRRLVPLMLTGSAVGAGLLLWGRPAALQLGMGVFAIAYALHALSGVRTRGRLSPRWAVPFGLVGGVFSALFGSGGFVYAMYLAGRMDGVAQIRVTQSTLIGLSTLTRVMIFALAGVYAQAQIWALAAVLAGPMLLGTAIGRRITLALPRERFVRWVSVAVLCSGVALVWRHIRV